VTALLDPSPSRKALTTDVDTLSMWKEQTNHYGILGHKFHTGRLDQELMGVESSTDDGVGGSRVDVIASILAFAEGIEGVRALLACTFEDLWSSNRIARFHYWRNGVLFGSE
jgi:hypothetical protein